jgi:hypothetical protein
MLVVQLNVIGYGVKANICYQSAAARGSIPRIRIYFSCEHPRREESLVFALAISFRCCSPSMKPLYMTHGAYIRIVRRLLQVHRTRVVQGCKPLIALRDRLSHRFIPEREQSFRRRCQAPC